MMEYDFGGAQRIDLVGRNQLLRKITGYILRGGLHAVLLEGEGGIGKTTVLEAILKKAPEFRHACMAREVIDLYHVDVHTPEGLMRRVTEELGIEHFPETREVLDGLEKARRAGDTGLVGVQEAALPPKFLAEFAKLSKARGVVLAFDTTEVLEYERDPFHDSLGEVLPVMSVSDWLFRIFLPGVEGNVVLIMAGRPPQKGQGLVRDKMSGLRKKNPRLQYSFVPMQAFDVVETGLYLQNVAEAEHARGDAEAAKRLESHCSRSLDVTHFLTQGRPILLAMVADMIAHNWILPHFFNWTIEQLHEHNVQATDPQIEKALVLRIQESPSPIGETIRKLAWLPKGATPDLLGRLMGVDIQSAQDYLAEVSKLSLVKVRPKDRHVFLHDELYELLWKHLLRESSRQESDDIYGHIEKYYEERVTELQQRMCEQKNLASLHEARLRHAYVEEMHYRLRHQPSYGFAMYFWRAEEAIGAKDRESDMLLRTELLRTIAWLKKNQMLQDLDPREVDADVAIRWGMRALFFDTDPMKAQQIFAQVSERWPELMRLPELPGAHFVLYEAVARMRQGGTAEREAARKCFEEIDKAMRNRLQQAESADPYAKSIRWRARLLLAITLNYQGYINREEGRYLRAVACYQESLWHQRKLASLELSPTLTNLAYATALTGQFPRARLLIEDAEGTARRTGNEHALARAFNTHALLEILDGQPESGLGHAEAALRIAQLQHDSRLRGLIHLTTARAMRYQWSTATPEKQSGAFQRLVDNGIEEILNAINMLSRDVAYRVEALVEKGCIQREIARHHFARGRRDEARDMGERSRESFEQAVRVAQESIDIGWLQALAWTNEGWLHYYLEEPESACAALDKAYFALPVKYRFHLPGETPPEAIIHDPNRARLPFWSTLGKAEMLWAWLHLDEYRKAAFADKEALQRAVEHITLSLAYDELIAAQGFDIRRGEQGLYQRIQQDHLGIPLLYKYAAQAAERWEFKQPTRFQDFLNRMFGTAQLWTEEREDG